MNINELAKEYKTLMEEEANIKAKKEELKSQIIEAMGDSKKVVSEDNIVVSLTDKVNVVYADEFAIIGKLKEMGLLSYVVEQIDKTKFNKAIKDQASLKEAFGELISYQTSTSLSVK